MSSLEFLYVDQTTNNVKLKIYAQENVQCTFQIEDEKNVPNVYARVKISSMATKWSFNFHN